MPGTPHRLSDHGFGGLDRLAAHGAGALAMPESGRRDRAVEAASKSP
jgi:hypothetical protein